jgi:putative ABC transport system permease protein
MIPLRISVAHLRHTWLRALLTVLSVAITAFLFCTLRTVVVTLENMVNAAAGKRVVTQSAISLFVQMPISMWQQFQGIPGVKAINHWTWFGGTYIDERQFFARFGTDVPTFRAVYGDQVADGPADILLTPEEWQEFERNRTACIVGSGLSTRYGWKIGSRVPLVGSIFPGDYDLTIAGIYDVRKGSGFDRATLFFHWDYMNEVAGKPNRVSTYTLRLEDEDQAGEVSAIVDAKFANSSTRTRTFTERAFNAQFVQMWGPVPLLLSWIGAAVLFACFMITLNTMLLLARERFREIGILKAIGFGEGTVAALALIESVMLCLLGALLGAAASVGFYRLESVSLNMESFLPGFSVSTRTAGEAIGVGLVLGLVSGLATAAWVRRLSVLAAMRSIG